MPCMSCYVLYFTQQHKIHPENYAHIQLCTQCVLCCVLVRLGIYRFSRILQDYSLVTTMLIRLVTFYILLHIIYPRNNPLIQLCTQCVFCCVFVRLRIYRFSRILKDYFAGNDNVDPMYMNQPSRIWRNDSGELFAAYDIAVMGKR